MPEMGASELLREFENLKFAKPVILMSGFSQTKLEFFLERPNVFSIIRKPFRAAELQQAVYEAVLNSSRAKSNSNRIERVA
jgi:FixJ family two-component response regulator